MSDLIDRHTFEKINKRASDKCTIIAVSKKQANEKIKALYDLSQRHFGENYVQEMCSKHAQLPSDIIWHFIGTLQRNKVKYIAPFVTWIHSVDSIPLLDEIELRTQQQQRIIQILLQLHVAKEETKSGLRIDEFQLLMQALQQKKYTHVCIRGVMGMASFTKDTDLIRQEFKLIKSIFESYKSITLPFVQWDTISMGMSNDYEIAIEEGSTMIRIGSLIFGKRTS